MTRLARVILRAYPPEFRARCGAGFLYALGCDADRARARGVAAVAVFWVLTAADAIVHGTAERRAAARRRKRDPLAQERRNTMTSLMTMDWRDAWRSLGATPVVTSVAVLSLALGIGANTALFSILNTLIFKPLPVRDPGQLVAFVNDSWTNPIWEALRDRRAAFVDRAMAWSAEKFNVSTGPEMDPVNGMFVSGGFFDGLGVATMRGRTIGEQDDSRKADPAASAVAVISHGFWQRRFGGGEVVGQTISIDRVPFTIVGVTDHRFLGPDTGGAFDVAVPIAAQRVLRPTENGLDDRQHWWLNLMFRMRPGQTIEDANARLRAIQPQVRLETMPAAWRPEEQATYLKDPLTLVPAGVGRSDLRRRYERPLTAIMVVVGLVLLIACANIANLLLARAVARRHELSVRLALGASRLRLARQLLAESVMLTAAGAVLGLLLAAWGSRLLVAQLTTLDRAVTLDLSLDWRVLAFTMAVAGTTSLLFGLAPAFGISSLAPNDALREQGRGTTGDRRLGVRSALVVAQVALSLALVVAAGLFTRTFVGLTTRDAGFERRAVLVGDVSVRRSRVDAGQRPALFERLRESAAAVPGVTHAAASFTTPVASRGWNTFIDLPGTKAGVRERLSWVNAVSPGWFETLGIRLVAGRDFDARDREGAPPVAIVNRAFAARFVKAEQPIGATFAQGPKKERFEIVGVVEDTVYRSLRSEMTPTYFIPVAQWDERSQITLVIRGIDSAMALAKPVGDRLRQVEPDADVSFHLLDDQVNASLTQERLVARLSAFFGALALLLAGLGLYGVTAYSISRRRTEIGIRMALGASAAGVVRLVLTRIGWLVGAGIVAGAALSLGAGKFVSSLLWGLEPRDPVTVAAAALALALVALVAGWLPARRASRI
ncbi:MAG TPA: ABC transporter permease, partial [Vicinamibacterales bacterium]|nr:ABC transporter permease [Vicinamibacterales bacterium]